MKCKAISILIILIFTLSACSSFNTTVIAPEGISIVATNFPAYDFTRQIAGDNANIHMLIKPGSEVHSYEPTPGDIQLINDCDMFVYVGGESDSWLDAVLDTVNNPHIKIIKMMDCVNNLEEEFSQGMEIKGDAHDHTHHSDGEKHTEYDEHVWTSPVNAIKISGAIADGLIEIDPSNEKLYLAREESYHSELNALHQAITEVVSNSKRRVLVFGDRFPLFHFVKEYGLEYYAAYPGCAAESEPDVATVAFLIEKVKEEDIPVVFHTELANEKMCDIICEETGAEKGLFSACHNVTAQQFEQGVTYTGLMQDNLRALEKALN